MIKLRWKLSFWRVHQSVVASPNHICSFSIMAWRCHGKDHQELISNLKKNNIIKSPEVEAAMLKVDRGCYMTSTKHYADAPQPLGYGATISAPHMHAYCLELLKDHLTPGENALDVGSGSGYLTACMAQMVGESGKVVGIEHFKELTDMSKDFLKKGNPELMKRIEIRCGDGRLGHPDSAPYNAIHVGAAAPTLPNALIEQLKPGGRLIIPVGSSGDQHLEQIDKALDGTIKRTKVMGVMYVPLTDHPSQRT